MAGVRAVSRSGGGDQPYRGDIVVPPDAEPGDLFVVCHIVDNDIASPDAMTSLDSGFVARAAYGPQYQPRLKLWTRPLVADDIGEPFTFQHNTATGNRSWALVGLACFDVDPDNPLDVPVATNVVQSNGGNARNTLTNASLTPSVAGGLSIVMGSGTRYATGDVGAQFFTPPANWVERHDVGQVWLKPTVYTRDNVPAAGSGAANAAIANSGAASGYSTMHVMLRHKAAAPPQPRNKQFHTLA